MTSLESRGSFHPLKPNNLPITITVFTKQFLSLSLSLQIHSFSFLQDSNKESAIKSRKWWLEHCHNSQQPFRFTNTSHNNLPFCLHPFLNFPISKMRYKTIFHPPFIIRSNPFPFTIIFHSACILFQTFQFPKRDTK